jgi:antitoxin PrlF
MSGEGVRYVGTVTTSGNSEAIRLEKSLFRAHPEFGRNRRVTATVIAPGQMLVSVADEAAAEADDPVLEAFLAFLAADIERHPERIEAVSPNTVERIVELTHDIEVDDNEGFPDDVTL